MPEGPRRVPDWLSEDGQLGLMRILGRQRDRHLLEDYDPSRSPVSYDVMYLPFPFIYGAMFGWDVPSRVDPLLLAMFLFLQVMSPAPSLRTCPGHLGGRPSEFSTS